MTKKRRLSVAPKRRENPYTTELIKRMRLRKLPRDQRRSEKTMTYPSGSTYETMEFEEAASRAKDAVRALSNDLGMPDAFVVSSVVKDYGCPVHFPYQAIVSRIAESAGFAVQVEVAPDRRGFVHRLVFRRVRSTHHAPRAGERLAVG